MAKFTITFQREVTVYDEFTREIEADTLEQARAIAEAQCPAYNLDCPDDAHETGAGGPLGDWYVNDVEVAA